MPTYKITVKNMQLPEDGTFTIATDNPYLHVRQQVDQEIQRRNLLRYEVYDWYTSI